MGFRSRVHARRRGKGRRRGQGRRRDMRGTDDGRMMDRRYPWINERGAEAFGAKLSNVFSEEVLRRLFVVELFKFGVLYRYV